MPVKIEIEHENAQGVLMELKNLSFGLFKSRQEAVDDEALPGAPAPVVAEPAAATHTAATPAEPAVPKTRTRAKKTAQSAEMQIRTNPEDRVEAEQDAEDEAAESAAAPALTKDAIRSAAADYVAAYGAEAATDDLSKIVEKQMGYTSISSIPDDPAIIAKVVAVVKASVSENPFKRAKAA